MSWITDQVGLALHTSTRVREARIRLYIHHMIQNWPDFDKEAWIRLQDVPDSVADRKKSAWNDPFVGMNIHSEVSDKDLEDLQKVYKVWSSVAIFS